jgi:hypothetical protein
MLAAATLAPDHAEITRSLAETARYDEHCISAAAAESSTAGFERVPVSAALLADAGVDGADGVDGVDGVDGAGAVLAAYVSVAPLMPAAECARAIADAEAHVAAEQAGSWATQRHFAVPTTDLQVCAVPRLLEWFGAALRERIFPALGAQYGVVPGRMRVIDAFLVKYEAKGGQVSLPLHSDQSEYSLTMPLNEQAEFEGGGTYFAGLGRALNCCAGGIVAFPGRLTHGAAPITAGVRYVIVAFLYEHREEAPEAHVCD